MRALGRWLFAMLFGGIGRLRRARLVAGA